MITKPISLLEKEDLFSLAEEKVPESKTIEYKVSLPDNTYDQKKEFLSDISSFANASGGFLIFGIREENGIAVELTGLEEIDPDAEILRLENLQRDNIEPRIPGISFRSIEVDDESFSIVAYIPRSWAGPHVVSYQKHWRFYSRTSAGKYPLDVIELRSAFQFSHDVITRINSFRNERVSRIVADETPILLEGIGKLIIHLIPLSTADPSQVLDITDFISKREAMLAPITSHGWNSRYNLDGYLIYSPGSHAEVSDSYLQLFRNGSIEAVNSYLLSKTRGDSNVPYIPSIKFEEEIINFLSRIVLALDNLGVSPPILFLVSMINVRGYIISASQSDMFMHGSYPIERDNIILPEVVISNFQINSPKLLKPVFDAIWNASGWPHSMNFDEKGEWKPKK